MSRAMACGGLVVPSPLVAARPSLPRLPLPFRIRATTTITFHVESTSITVPFSQTAARGVGKSIEDLLGIFKEKSEALRPRRWDTMEYRHAEDGVSLELFCNPNAYANAFQAKILLTVRDEKMTITSEGQLSAIKADIDQYVEAYV